MKNTKYNKIADKHKASEDKVRNVVVAFISGGVVGFFDKLVTMFKCGLLIPITGFAHSMTSSALDYKEEGLIYGIGSNMFKLAGSVIIYGVVSAWIFGMIRFLIGGVM